MTRLEALIKAVYIRRAYNFNKDEGRYHLSHLYDHPPGGDTYPEGEGEFTA